MAWGMRGPATAGAAASGIQAIVCQINRGAGAYMCYSLMRASTAADLMSRPFSHASHLRISAPDRITKNSAGPVGETSPVHLPGWRPAHAGN